MFSAPCCRGKLRRNGPTDKCEVAAIAQETEKKKKGKKTGSLAENYMKCSLAAAPVFFLYSRSGHTRKTLPAID